MKKFTINSINRISFLLMLLVAGTLFSCEEEDPTVLAEAKAAPVIEAIRSMNPAKADSTFKQSTLGSTIVIKGQNLENIRFVSFNGYNASFNTAYASKNYLMVRIPEQTPTVATATNVSNKLVVGNSKGEVSYDFTVLPPAPVIEAMSNEFVKAGETLTFYGKYFYFIKDVTFPGGVKGTNITASPDGLSLTVTVPAGFDPTKGDVIVTSESGRSGASRRTKLYSGTGIINNWDNVYAFDWGIALEKIVSSYSGFEAIDGKFGVIDQVVPGGWGWNNDKVISLGKSISATEKAPILPTVPAEKYNPNAPIENFDFKIEVAAASGSSLEGLELLVWIPGTPAGTVEKAYALSNFIKSTDGKWYTLSVPLAELATSSGAKMAKYSDINPKEIRTLIQNPTAVGIPAKLAFDNYRIENMIVR